jgi:hypothetical protein
MVKAERRELREKVYGPYPDESHKAAEEQKLIEIMKNLVPGETMKFIRELGLLPEQTK